jgi:hypothetical protein
MSYDERYKKLDEERYKKLEEWWREIENRLVRVMLKSETDGEELKHVGVRIKQMLSRDQRNVLVAENEPHLEAIREHVVDEIETRMLDLDLEFFEKIKYADK